MTKDAEEAARDYCSKYPMWGNEHSENLFKAGWQAKESREKELWDMLERCIKFIEMPSSYAFPKALASELIADFEKMKSAPSVEPKTPIPGK